MIELLQDSVAKIIGERTPLLGLRRKARAALQERVHELTA